MNFEDVESKTFIVRLLFEWDNFRRPTSSASSAVVCRSHSGRRPRENRLRLEAAPQGGILRQGRGCAVFALKRGRGGCHDKRWPGASEAGPEIPSPTRGTSTRFGIENSEKKFAFAANVWKKLWLSTPKNAKNVRINDQKVVATCQYEWRTGDLSITVEHKSPDGPLSRMLQRIDSKLF